MKKNYAIILIFGLSLSIIYQEALEVDKPLPPKHETIAHKVKTKLSEELCSVVLDAAPQRVKDIVTILNDPVFPEQCKPRRIFLYGPSGSGKTLLSHVIGQLLDRPTIFIPAGLLATEYKESAKENFLKAVQPFINNPCVLIVDEAEVLLKQKSPHHPDHDTPRSMWQLLDEYAKLPHIFTILIGNSITGLQQELQTRFTGETIEHSGPNTDQLRRKIICTHLKGTFHVCSDPELDQIVQDSRMLSPRELEKLVNEAKLQMYLRKKEPLAVMAQDFDAALTILKESHAALSKNPNKESENQGIISRMFWSGLDCVKQVIIHVASAYIVINHITSDK